ncbi:MAG TPA: HD domain-containing protein [candidate division WOR-3 bacterium]|uniref:HD domain-containing protein n=1 Tax=candidate division WOR-3 bacterium TaxID=2052148 RepID=A0A7C0VBQ6_UNCW3|nr:HD domain-containing protein [candidate division WOR-3 bacterium]
MMYQKIKILSMNFLLDIIKFFTYGLYVRKSIEILKEELKQENLRVKDAFIFHSLLPPLYEKEVMQIFHKSPDGINWHDGICVVKKDGKGIVFKVEEESKPHFKNWIEVARPFVFTLIEISAYNYINNEIMALINEIAETDRIEYIYDHITVRIARILKADLAVFTLYDSAGNMVYAVGPGYNLTPEQVNIFRFKLEGNSIARVAMENRKSYFTNDAFNDPYIKKEFVKYFNVKHVICSPIFVFGNPFGFIYIARHPEKEPFMDEEVELLDYINSHISLLLRFLKSLDGFRKRSEALVNLDKAGRLIVAEMDIGRIFDLIVSVATELFNADACSLMLQQENEKIFRIVSASGLSEEYRASHYLTLEEVLRVKDEHYKGKPIFIKNLSDVIERDRDLIGREGIVSVLSVPILVDEEIYGILNLYSKKEVRYDEESFDILEAFALEVSIAIKNAELYEKAVSTTSSIIKVLSELESQKDSYTMNHSENVARLAVRIGIKMGLSEDELDALYKAGLLHDIGKVIVEKQILRKPGPLGEEERKEMEEHPVIGARIISHIKGLEKASEIVLHHHERYDGKGYPYRLKGEEIPLCARILTVADSIEAMMSERPYRPSMSLEQIIEELKREKGKQFDPKVVDVAINLLMPGK